jgi:hypothetical protein
LPGQLFTAEDAEFAEKYSPEPLALSDRFGKLKKKTEIAEMNKVIK